MASSESPYGPSITPVASTPGTPVGRRRRLGVASLVLSLTPIAIGVVFFIITIVTGVLDSTGWAALGWLVFGLFVTGGACIVLGGLAIILGIVAIVKGRGRGFGIAGIVIGSIGILITLPALTTFSL